MDTALDTDKMRKLIGMMSSDNANERSNAAKLFSDYLKKFGVEHDELSFKHVRRVPNSLFGIKEEAARASLEAQEALRRMEDEKRLKRYAADDRARLKFEVATLRTFVSNRVLEIVARLVEDENHRLLDLRGAEQPADYRKDAGGRPAWAKDKLRK